MVHINNYYFILCKFITELRVSWQKLTFIFYLIDVDHQDSIVTSISHIQTPGKKRRESEGRRHQVWKQIDAVKVESTQKIGRVVVPLTHFLALQVQLVVLVSAFVMVSTVWSVSCLLFFYSWCPPCPAICKSGGSAPVPDGVGATESTPLCCFTLLGTEGARPPYFQGC